MYFLKTKLTDVKGKGTAYFCIYIEYYEVAFSSQVLSVLWRLFGPTNISLMYLGT